MELHYIQTELTQLDLTPINYEIYYTLVLLPLLVLAANEFKSFKYSSNGGKFDCIQHKNNQ